MAGGEWFSSLRDYKGEQRATIRSRVLLGRRVDVQAHPRGHGNPVGYTGGHTDDPSYYDVCSDTTGHAEADEIESTPSRSPTRSSLPCSPEPRSHDPKPAGPGHRQPVPSSVFFHSPEQEEQALKVKAAIQAGLPSGRHRAPETFLPPRTTRSSTWRNEPGRAARRTCRSPGVGMPHHDGWLIREQGPRDAAPSVLLRSGARSADVFYDDLLAEPTLAGASLQLCRHDAARIRTDYTAGGRRHRELREIGRQTGRDLGCDLVVGHQPELRTSRWRWSLQVSSGGRSS